MNAPIFGRATPSSSTAPAPRIRPKSTIVEKSHFGDGLYSKGNQSNKESIDRVSGSGVFARDPDSVIAVTRHEVEEVFVVEATLRNFKPLEPFCIRWEYPLMQKDATLNPRKLKGNLSKTPQYDVKKLLGSLAESSKTKAELKKAVMEQAGMGETTFRRLFLEMEKAEGVNLDVATKKYSYRLAGQNQLS